MNAYMRILSGCLKEKKMLEIPEIKIKIQVVHKQKRNGEIKRFLP